MKFFDRCRMLCKILSVLCVLMGVFVFLTWLWLPKSDFYLVDSVSNRELFLFIFIISVWLILILNTIILHCIIKDAEEDFNAIKSQTSN